MPIDYRVDGARGLVLVTASGEVTCAEVLEHRRRLFADPGVPAGWPRLIDSAGSALPSSGELRAISGVVCSVAPAPARGRCAIVVARPAWYGLGRMFEVFTEDAVERYRVFDDRDAALRWLCGDGDSPDEGAFGEA